MAKKLENGNWACEHQGCNYTNTKEGYVRNHEKLKHGGSGDNKGGQETTKETSKAGFRTCPDCKGHNVRLLNSLKHQEALALKYGHKYICENCEEVFK